MKKASRKLMEDMRSEYDFASMKGGVRGKYAERYRAGTNLVLLDPEVARAFPTEAAVNNALRAALKIVEAMQLPHDRSGQGTRKSRLTSPSR
jgi:hypothetical protein